MYRLLLVYIKEFFYTFKNIEYYDDQNYLFSDRNLHNFTAFAASWESVHLRPQSTTTIPNSFLAISINNSTIKQVYTRRYYKVQNCIADLGRIIKGIILIASGINYFFSYRYYMIDIINYNLGNYCSMNENQEKFSDYLKIADIADKSSNTIKSCDIKYNKVNNYIEKYKRMKELSFPFYLSCIPNLFFLRGSKTRKFFDESNILKQATKKQMDISYILKKFDVVDKLTYIFFGSNLNRIEMASNPYMFYTDKGENDKLTPSGDFETFQNYILGNYNYLINS